MNTKNENSKDRNEQDKREELKENPFYSYINKDGQSFLFGLSKLKFLWVLSIFIFLIVGGWGAHYFTNVLEEKRQEERGEAIEKWLISIEGTLCAEATDEKACMDVAMSIKSILTTIEDEEKNEEGLDLEAYKQEVIDIIQSTENQNVGNLSTFISKEDIERWIEVCAQHPDINAKTPILFCLSNMLVLDLLFTGDLANSFLGGSLNETREAPQERDPGEALIETLQGYIEIRELGVFVNVAILLELQNYLTSPGSFSPDRITLIASPEGFISHINEQLNNLPPEFPDDYREALAVNQETINAIFRYIQTNNLTRDETLAWLFLIVENTQPPLN